MFLSYIALGLFSVLSFANWSAVAQEKFDSTQDVYWRWNDFGDERTDDTSIFRGAVHVSWSRNAGCVIPRDDPDHPRITPNPIPLKVSIDTINNSRDYLYPQPDIISYGVHTKKHKCDAHAKATIQIFRFADSGQTIKLEITNICIDNDCSGKSLPDVNCLRGPVGKVIMYRGYWVNPCTETYVN